MNRIKRRVAPARGLDLGGSLPYEIDDEQCMTHSDGDNVSTTHSCVGVLLGGSSSLLARRHAPTSSRWVESLMIDRCCLYQGSIEAIDPVESRNRGAAQRAGRCCCPSRRTHRLNPRRSSRAHQHRSRPALTATRMRGRAPTEASSAQTLVPSLSDLVPICAGRFEAPNWSRLEAAHP